MKYDPSQIKTDYVEINGKKVPIQRIPAGMHGPNGPISTSYDDSFSEEDYEDFTADDPQIYKEYREYMEDGVDPDCDEVRQYKDDIELEKIKSSRLLDIIDSDEVFDEDFVYEEIETEDLVDY